MTWTLSFLLRHGAFILFGVVFLEQVGFPLPAAPFLLAAGALAGRGQMNLAACILLASLASLLADLIWFYLGRIHGKKVLRWLCRFSFRPEMCVIRSERHFKRHGMRYVLFGKFIPGLNTVLPPMAGSSQVTWRRFLFFDALSSILYTGTYILLGFIFRRQLRGIASLIEGLGWKAGVLFFFLLAVYILYKFLQNRRMRRWT